MGQFNEGWEVEFNEWTETFDETRGHLRREFGEDLIAYTGDGEARGVVDLETFVQRCYPRQVLDVIEAFYICVAAENKQAFQQALNQIFHEEEQPWRLQDGEFFKLDSEFLDMEVLARTEELLAANSYAGALDEFREARNELTAGQTREAIAKAQAAFESTMKTILGVDDGNAASLIRDLASSGFFDDLPSSTQPMAFGDQVLRALVFMGNRLGRHGQGEEVVDVHRRYAELAVHLSGSFIRLLVDRQLELQGHSAVEEQTSENVFVPPADFPAATDDDIPF